MRPSSTSSPEGRLHRPELVRARVPVGYEREPDAERIMTPVGEDQLPELLSAMVPSGQLSVPELERSISPPGHCKGRVGSVSLPHHTPRCASKAEEISAG